MSIYSDLIELGVDPVFAELACFANPYRDERGRFASAPSGGVLSKGFQGVKVIGGGVRKPALDKGKQADITSSGEKKNSGGGNAMPSPYISMGEEQLTFMANDLLAVAKKSQELADKSTGRQKDRYLSEVSRLKDKAEQYLSAIREKQEMAKQHETPAATEQQNTSLNRRELLADARRKGKDAERRSVLINTSLDAKSTALGRHLLAEESHRKAAAAYEVVGDTTKAKKHRMEQERMKKAIDQMPD